MNDIRQDFHKTAQDLTRTATEAAYVAVGLGVIGIQRAQVRRQELVEAVERVSKGGIDSSLTEARKELAKRVKDLDDAVGQLIEVLDAHLHPVAERLPASAQAVVQQAKEARDQLRVRIVDFAA